MRGPGRREKGVAVGFSALCKSGDPLLKFIRDTYGAVPVSLPDNRWNPFAIFTVDRDRVRYLGNVAELAGAGEPPRVEEVRLPHLTYEKSSEMRWGAAVGLAEPFLAATTGVGLDLEASATMERHRETRARVSLGPTSRRFCSALGIASWLERQDMGLPETLGGLGALYIVDSALYAKELSFSVDGESATKFTLDLEASIVGKVKPDLVLRSNSAVQITGVRAAAFGITCLEVTVDEQGRLRGIRLATREPRAAATDVALMQAVPHVALGEGNELMQFDD